MPAVECFRATQSTHRYGRHSHEGYAIGVIEVGVGGNRIRGSEQFFPAGNVVAMNPDEPHTGYAAGSTPLSYRMFYLSAAAFQWLMPDSRTLPHFTSHCIAQPAWHAKLRALHQTLEQTPEVLQRQVEMVETFSAFAAAFGAAAPRQQRTTHDPLAIRQIKQYLHECYSQSVRLDQLSQLAAVDRAHLIRTFRRHTGLPPHTYLVQIRVAHAKRLLATGMPIAAVALEVGFVDQSHLTRRFKQITGLTPKLFIAGHFRPRRSGASTVHTGQPSPGALDERVLPRPDQHRSRPRANR